jgi:hypothetical protein
VSRLLTIVLAIAIALSGLIATPDSTLASKKKKKKQPTDSTPPTEFSCLYQPANGLVALLLNTIPGDPDEGFTLVIAGAEYVAPQLFRSTRSLNTPRSWVTVETLNDIKEDLLINKAVNGKLSVAIDPSRGLGSFSFIDRDNGVGVTLTNVEFDCTS